MPTADYIIPTVWSVNNGPVVTNTVPATSLPADLPHVEEIKHNSLVEEIGTAGPTAASTAGPTHRGKRDVTSQLMGGYTTPSIQ